MKDGKVKVLGVTSFKRLPFLPEVPTLHEQGLKNFEVSDWLRIYGPRGTPAEIVQKVNAACGLRLPAASAQLTIVRPPSGGAGLVPLELKCQL